MKIEFAKVGFLGPNGTFSHQAALKIKAKQYFSFSTINEVFEKVKNKDIDFGVVPAENSIGGRVTETLDCLINYPIKVNTSFDVAIHHCLLAKTSNIKDIKTIESHPQALYQCNDWIKKNLPKVKIISASSTIIPIIKTANQDKGIGFIGSKTASQIYNLHILAKNIEKNYNNLTRFYLISTKINNNIYNIFKPQKTLIFLEVYDGIGVLRDILNIFVENKLNLTSLHSIPNYKQPWKYFFLIEVDAPLLAEKIKYVLSEVDKFCSAIKILGATN